MDEIRAWMREHLAATGLILVCTVTFFGMSDRWLPWVEAHGTLALWVQGVGTFMAAVVALVAANIVLRGTREQAQAPFELEGKKREEARKALALMLWAEIVNCELALKRLVRELPAKPFSPSSSVSQDYRDNLRPIQTSVYSANLKELSSLGLSDIFAVVQYYAVIHEVNMSIDSLRKGYGNMKAVSLLEHQTQSAYAMSRTISNGLAGTAGIEQGILDGLRKD